MKRFLVQRLMTTRGVMGLTVIELHDDRTLHFYPLKTEIEATHYLPITVALLKRGIDIQSINDKNKEWESLRQDVDKLDRRFHALNVYAPIRVKEMQCNIDDVTLLSIYPKLEILKL